MQESLQAVRKTYFSILIVRIYDLESGKKINEIKRENIIGVTDRNIQTFDYRIIVYKASRCCQTAKHSIQRRIIYAVLSTEYTKKKCSNGMTVKLGSDTVEKYDLKRKSQRELKTIIEKALQNYYENVQEVE